MTIPRGDFKTPGPCWIPRDDAGTPIRPLIKCKCGKLSTGSAHHIHADGTITASWYHAVEPIPSQNWPGGGCGFHDCLILADYDQGEYPPYVFRG